MATRTVVVFAALFCATYLQLVNSMWTDFAIIAIDTLNATDSKPAEFDLRLKRIKKGVFGISGTVSVTEGFNDYTAEVVVFHSAARNNDYKLIPAKIPEGNACDKVNNEYRKYIMKDVHAVSDLPYSEDEKADICEMFTPGSTFEVKSYEFDQSPVPKFLQPGYYKALILISKAGVPYCGLQVLVDLS